MLRCACLTLLQRLPDASAAMMHSPQHEDNHRVILTKLFAWWLVTLALEFLDGSHCISAAPARKEAVAMHVCTRPERWR